MNVVKLHLGKAIAVVALLFSLTHPAIAQELKIGVVNVPVLMEQAPQARVAMGALEEEFQPRQREILAKQTEFKDLSEKVQRDIAVMATPTDDLNSSKSGSYSSGLPNLSVKATSPVLNTLPRS